MVGVLPDNIYEDVEVG